MKDLKLEDKFSKIRIHLLWDREDKGHAFYGAVLVKMKIIEKYSNGIPSSIEFQWNFHRISIEFP